MKDYAVIAVELVFGFVALFTMTKLLGKAHMSQVTPFDFISALIMGELLGNAVYDQDIHLGKVFFAAVVWGSLIYANGWLTRKFNGLRRILEGKPAIVIRDGLPQYGAMKKNNLDLSELQSLIRQEGYFAFQDVEFAILETNGKVSVMPKSAKDLPKRGDFSMPDAKPSLPVALILDGEVQYEKLRDAGIDERRLLEEMGKQRCKSYRDVFYAEWVEGGSLLVCPY